MKKISKFFITFLVLFFILTGCSAKSDLNNGQVVEQEQTSAITTSSSRLVIYTYQAEIYVEDISSSLVGINDIFNELKDGSFIFDQTINDYYAKLVYRIKTDVYLDFIEHLKSLGTFKNEEIKGEDITDKYVDLVAYKAAKEEELKRLNGLMALATSLNDVIKISDRITEVEADLYKINSEINKYDGLIEYTKVTLFIYQNDAIEEKQGFFAKMGSAFKGMWNFTKEAFTFLLQVLIYLLPLIIVIGGPATAFLLHNKKKCKERELLLQKQREKNASLHNLNHD